MKYIFLLIIMFTFNACITLGYTGFVQIQDDFIGGKLMHYQPYKYENSGEIIRANYLVQGEGFTHITQDENGNNVHHYFISEVLNKSNVAKRFVGKCLIYKVVDNKTGIVLNWGFDKGGNPQSCRVWS